MRFILPVESIVQNLGGVILYDPMENKILRQYVHDKKWKRVGWRGGKLIDDILIATDWQDLHYFDVRKWKYLKAFKKSTFNDLHYVEINNDKLYIVNTGLDAIEIFNYPFDPKFIELIHVYKRNKEIFKQRDIDLTENHNEKLKIKPHSCHPNCISFDKKRIFVTCFGKEQRFNTGEVIELNSGKRLTKKCFDCHDGIFYKNDFYLTRTRNATVLIFEDLWSTKIPMRPTRSIKLGNRGWWRGMIIQNDILFVFASDGYKRKKVTARLCIYNLKTGKNKKQKLPVLDGIYWDTIYQPNIWESS